MGDWDRMGAAWDFLEQHSFGAAAGMVSHEVIFQAVESLAFAGVARSDLDLPDEASDEMFVTALLLAAARSVAEEAFRRAERGILLTGPDAF